MYDMFNAKTAHQRKCLLIFRHRFFTDEDLWNSSIVLKNNEPNKFSILGELDNSFKINGKFEFLLEYPKLEGFNMWSQLKNPVKAEPNVENGYKEIKCSWKEKSFHGLAKSSSTGHTFIDGSVFDADSEMNHFYSIGLYVNWKNSIPGPFSTGDLNKTSEVLLWVRISSKCSCNIRRTHNSYMNYLFVMLIAS